MKNKTLYLASPYGFSDQCKTKLLPEFINILESMGAKVLEPFKLNCDKDISIPGWANRIALSNYQDLKNSDAIFAIVNGTPPDEGVMVELGVAIALRKPTFLFRDDFRTCSDSDEYPLNLMIFMGIPYDCWDDYYYRSLVDIKNKDKAIYRWLEDYHI
tara:strand:+ start:424 stop:897 length:474 start_codon:yes stop_codon:yes gene_type:complete